MLFRSKLKETVVTLIEKNQRGTNERDFKNEFVYSRRSYRYKLLTPVFMMLAICLPTYIVKCLPASSVTTVSANVGTGFPTTFGISDGSPSTGFTSNETLSEIGGSYFVMQSYSTCKVKIFDKDALLLLLITPGYSQCRAAVLKDPLKLFIGREGVASGTVYNLQSNAGQLTSSSTSTIAAPFKLSRLYDEPDTSYIAVESKDGKVFRYDTAANAYGAIVPCQAPGSKLSIMYKTDGLFVAKSQIVIDRTNFQVIKNVYKSSYDLSFAMLDNLSEETVFWPQSSVLYKANLTASVTVLTVENSVSFEIGRAHV